MDRAGVDRKAHDGNVGDRFVYNGDYDKRIAIVVKTVTAERGEDLEEKKMTRAEKIETLKILAGMTEEQKSIFVIGVLLGEHKAKFGAQVKTEAQTA